MEEAIYDSYAMRRFMGLDFTVQQVPDATTLLGFRHLLERHELGQKLFAAQQEIFDRQGWIMRGGSIVDATKRVRFLTAGGAPPDLGVSARPSDSDVLGPQMPADGLTATLGFGSSLFDERFGLTPRKPARLTPMRVFPNDTPDPAWLHGDLSLQLCANHPDVIHHALRDITRHTRG